MSEHVFEDDPVPSPDPLVRQLLSQVERLRWVDSRTVGLLLLLVAARGAVGVLLDLDPLTQSFRSTSPIFGPIFPNYVRAVDAASLATGLADVVAAFGAIGLLMRWRTHLLAAGGFAGGVLCTVSQIIALRVGTDSGFPQRDLIVSSVYLAALAVVAYVAGPAREGTSG